MAKTYRLNLSDVAQWHNVAHALFRASRGKANKPEVKAALATPEATINRVTVALIQGRLPVARLTEFDIHDPKHRTIHAAPFLDRIAHHALMLHCEPVFERVLLPSVFACRPKKGVHRAILYAQKQFRRNDWVMHVDIRHFFPAIDHDILRWQLRRRFRGDGLRLMDSIIAVYQSDTGKGLPIGALSSQHFANHYLNDVDRWLLAQSGVSAHCRYMDDFLIWSGDKGALLGLREHLTRFLQDKLALTSKPPLIQQCAHSVLFCGTQIRRDRLRPSKRKRRRYVDFRQRLERCWLQGETNHLALQQRYDAIRAALLPADSRQYRRNDLRLRGSIDA